MLTSTKKIATLLIIVVGALAVTSSSVTAAATAKKAAPKIPSYAAKKIIASDPMTELARLEIYSYTIGSKNTGASIWQSDGPKSVTVKTTADGQEYSNSRSFSGRAKNQRH